MLDVHMMSIKHAFLNFAYTIMTYTKCIFFEYDEKLKYLKTHQTVIHP